MKTQHDSYDCVVVGAGPCGSTVASQLARDGYRVALLDKQAFPRFKVGESMIPFNYFPLERIGMIDKMRASDFTKKYSVQFVRQDGRASQPFYFDEHMDHACTQTWQVTRDLFDQMLLDHAKEQGVEVFEQMGAHQLLEEDGVVVGVEALGEGDEPHAFRARMTIDASGGARFAMRQQDWTRYDPNLSKLAVWGYFRGAQRDPGKDEGATTITYLDGKNWLWYIPLRDDMVSVGVVGDKDYIFGETKNLDAIFNKAATRNKWIEAHMAGSSLEGDMRVCTHQAYRAAHCARDGLVLAGDALSFLDPVFSTGMYLALSTAEAAGLAVHAALQKNDVSGRQFVEYGETMCAHIEALRLLVYAFYAKEFSFKSIVTKYPHLKGDITDILIGNLKQDFTELREALKEFMKVPDVLPYGGALV
jgi:flavin-dependent dehydrogenase